jgi:hypothetical protein
MLCDSSEGFYFSIFYAGISGRFTDLGIIVRSVVGTGIMYGIDTQVNWWFCRRRALWK